MNRLLLLGLIGLALLCVLCPYCRVPAIEEDLHGKALPGIDEADLGAKIVSISGRDITLSGAVPSQAVADGIEAGITEIAGVRVVHNQLEIERVLGFLTHYGDITMWGDVPNEACLRTGGSGSPVLFLFLPPVGRRSSQMALAGSGSRRSILGYRSLGGGDSAAFPERGSCRIARLALRPKKNFRSAHCVVECPHSASWRATTMRGAGRVTGGGGYPWQGPRSSSSSDGG